MRILKLGCQITTVDRLTEHDVWAGHDLVQNLSTSLECYRGEGQKMQIQQESKGMGEETFSN